LADFEFVTHEVRGKIATVTLNRPLVNALGIRLYRDSTGVSPQTSAVKDPNGDFEQAYGAIKQTDEAEIAAADFAQQRRSLSGRER
jgi:hypothetical protein